MKITSILPFLVLWSLGALSQHHSGEPKWSHDGRKIVFVGADPHENIEGKYPGKREIWMMNANGSNRKQLTFNSEHANEYPILSPDNRTILFSSNETGKWKLYTINADGSNKKDLGLEPTSDVWNDPCRADWSPDGNYFVFPITKNGVRTLHIASADVSQIRELPEAIGIYPHWSHDGKALVYYSKGNIYTISVDGTNKRQLTNIDIAKGIRACYPQWSPNDDFIFFLKGENVFRIKPDGSDEKQITNVPGAKWYLGISIRNKMIYGAIEDGKDEIYLCDTSGSSRSMLTR